MYPRLSDLFQGHFGIQFPFPLYSYGALLALAFLLATWLTRQQLNRMYQEGHVGAIQIKFRFSNKHRAQRPISAPPSVLVIPMLIVAIVAGILGSKVFYALEYADRFLADPMQMILTPNGLTFYGGLLVAAFCVLLYAHRRGLRASSCLEATAPGLMLAYAIGRLGCHLAGDGDWGVVADLSAKPAWLPTGLWAESYPNNILGVALPEPGVYPTPLYEFALCVLLFSVLWALRRHQFRNGWLFSVYLIFNGMERFLIEQIRVNPTFDVFGLSITQAEGIAVLLFLMGMVGLYATSKRTVLESIGEVTSVRRQGDPNWQYLPALSVLATAWILLTAFVHTSCAPYSILCDPFSEEYEPARCLAEANRNANWLVFGQLTDQPPPLSQCPQLVKCSSPYCKYVETDGGFETLPLDTPTATGWSGDLAKRVHAPFRVCAGVYKLQFVATTPEGPSDSPSAEIVQVINLKDQAPEAQRQNWRRIRAQAAFNRDGTSDSQFGLHLAAYASDPTAPTSARLAYIENMINSDEDQATWEAVLTEMLLPEDANFLVVILEAYENDENQNDSTEFGGHFVDEVRVALDKGNTPPFASDDLARTNEDTPIEIHVLSNDTDIDGFLDRASLTIVRRPENGEASTENHNPITYTPDDNFFGEDTLTYVVSDQEGRTSRETMVSIWVNSVNDAPKATNDLYQIEGEDSLVVGAPGVLGNDTDVELEALAALLVSDVTNGSLTLNANGSFTYSPNQGFPGEDTFTYVANDGTDDSNVATVTLQQSTTANQPPTANDDEAGTGPGTPITIDVLDNDTDDDGTLDPSTVTITRNPSAGGTVTVLGDGSVRYVPPSETYTGEDTFRYTVADDDGSVSNEAIVTIGIG